MSLESSLYGWSRDHRELWRPATPGWHLQVYVRGLKRVDLRVGDTYEFYDLASLTKIIFTATALMRAHDQGILTPSVQVHLFFPSWRTPKLTLGHLMTHTAGLPWWLPLYDRVSGPLRPELRWLQVQKELTRLRPKRSVKMKAVYSDPDLWALGDILIQTMGQDLHAQWLVLADECPMGEMHFNPSNRRSRPRSLYAPTDRCLWRRKLLQGEVHDDNAWAFGGVAPHAGLFGRAQDVADWALDLRRSLLGKKNRLASERVAKRFVGRRVPRWQGDFGYLFMKPSKSESSAGHFFSALSFGHTGFTGTSLWIDPKKDLIVVLLSNRLREGGRENGKFRMLRPLIHDQVVRSLEG